MQLRPCGRCRRHADLTDVTCSLCQAVLAPAAPRSTHGRLRRSAVFAAAVLTSATLAGACWTGSSTTTTTPVDHTQGSVDSDAPAIPAGTIRGIVRNSTTGAPLIGVRVLLRAEASGALAQGLTDEHGEYVFSSLQPGSYTITYQPDRPRQAPTQIRVELSADAGARGDFALQITPPG